MKPDKGKGKYSDAVIPVVEEEGEDDDSEDLYYVTQEQPITYPPPQKDLESSFGRDTAKKSAVYAGNKIYVEDMWGELVEAAPGYVPPLMRDCIPTIPDQSIPSIPGEPVPSLGLGDEGIDPIKEVGNMIKDAAQKFFFRFSSKVPQRIQSQRKPDSPAPLDSNYPSYPPRPSSYNSFQPSHSPEPYNPPDPSHFSGSSNSPGPSKPRLYSTR
ncbi:hypothetical protein M422DRAFT_37995 [Sphaerobolus stellatus SS14]|uniref:Uncharacterized protein n=1 Tax=Sphaerobolus stellatus (strain SS14) TaxID=990650 RepID=A0A0C9UNE9_SPHS4|nr:hypothetical protein M422DRAFT_37995 [Sphaerobolus stellatus SS14]